MNRFSRSSLRPWSRRRPAIGRVIACFIVSFGATAGAQTPAITPEVSIYQDELISGHAYTFRKVLESGRHLFTTPYTKEDGHGEGGAPGEDGSPQAGPRESDLEENIQELAARLMADPAALREALNFPFPGKNPANGERTIGFLRLNGLDSQSCFECHNSIGSDILPDTLSEAMGRRVGVTGGPAGVASNAFINEKLPDPMFMFVRNPPHVFGTGYAQKLAEEMSDELMRHKYIALGRAVLNPGERQEEQLTAKGVSFGTYAVTYNPPPDAARADEARRDSDRELILRGVAEVPGGEEDARRRAAEGAAAESAFQHDFSGLRGVSEDLMVRPFQWKGIASNERNFVKDALNFHFGMLAVEIEGSADDEDKDGVEDEVTIGNVTALTAFTMAIRPPMQVIPLGKDAEVEEGRELFSGESKIDFQASCAFCHKPSLTIEGGPMIVIHDPKAVSEEFVGNKVGLSAQRASVENLPNYQRFKKIEAELSRRGRARTGATREAFRAAASDEQARLPGYVFDLTLRGEGYRNLPSFTGAAVGEEYRRLEPDKDGKIEVPLFSDLRRHDMGEGLKDPFRQKTDNAQVSVPKREFLTRPLWGVADTGPWLHDGRARSLRQAILLHKSEGSEANQSVDAFLDLSDADQQAIIDFLLTLRLPVEEQFEAR